MAKKRPKQMAKATKRKKTAKIQKRRRKRSISPKEARRILGNVSQQYCFWVVSGAILKNLNELSRELERMNNPIFRYHVNKEKNDLSKWINEVFRDKMLADGIRKAKTKKQTQKILKSRINELKNIVARGKS